MATRSRTAATTYDLRTSKFRIFALTVALRLSDPVSSLPPQKTFRRAFCLAKEAQFKAASNVVKPPCKDFVKEKKPAAFLRDETEGESDFSS